jgi:hypothetical protein
MTNDRQLPKYVVEGQLLQRQSASTFKLEEERLNTQLNQLNELLKKRKERLCDLHRTVLDQWQEDVTAATDITAAPTSEEAPNEE